MTPDPAAPTAARARTPRELVAAVADAHRRLLDRIAGVTDDDLRAPSHLPGWSRGHVLAHLHDNALAFARMTREALAGRRIEMYDADRMNRDASIDLGARLPADAHRARLLAAQSDLDRLWSSLAPSDWERPAAFPGGRLVDTVAAREREVEIHLADLDLGVTPADWPERFASALITDVLPSLPRRLHGHDAAMLVATDGGDDDGRWWVVGRVGDRVEIRGLLTDLAAWLVGRVPDGPIAAVGQDLPALGPWV